MLEPPPLTAILYASLSSSNFRDLHTYLLSLSASPTPRVQYIMRHIPPRNQDVSEKNILSGYGVFLDLKKMDYLALDDRASHEGKRFTYVCIILAANLLKNPPPIGSNENDVADDSTHMSSNETDPILSLLQKYPVNDTAVEANVPLTEDELSRM